MFCLLVMMLWSLSACGHVPAEKSQDTDSGAKITSGDAVQVSSRKAQEVIRRTVIPVCLGGIMTLLLLIICVILPEYFQIYLKNMLGSHINTLYLFLF